ncbi:MAG: hypothetical protein K0S29_390 [Gammaproteobacteria bacterium]|jgi:hypothetical protein|nr:hypothetical protein [Gammaproteobacteria bacterium]
MTDWVVWPIFMVQFIAFALLVLKNKRFMRIHFKTWSLSILVMVCVLIVISLWHDSTDAVNLYF